jgi:hypothetical protein
VYAGQGGADIVGCPMSIFQATSSFNGLGGVYAIPCTCVATDVMTLSGWRALLTWLLIH